MPSFGIVGPGYTLDSKNASCQRCVNWYVERNESGSGKSQARLARTPGLRPFSVPTSADSLPIASVAVSRKGFNLATVKRIQVAGGTLGAQTSTSKGPKAVAQSGVGQEWTNISEAEKLDGIPAGANLSPAQYSKYLDVTGFGFDIPAGSELKGVVAKIYKRTTWLTAQVKDSVVMLLKGGGWGDNKAKASIWPAVSGDVVGHIATALSSGYDPHTGDYATMLYTVDSVSGFTVGSWVEAKGIDGISGTSVTQILAIDATAKTVTTDAPGGSFQSGTGGSLTQLDFSPEAYGSSADLWNAELTVDDVNASTFGIRVQCHNESLSLLGPAQVDYVELTVYYLPAIPNKLIVETAAEHSYTVGKTVGFSGVSAFSAINGWSGAITGVPDSTHLEILAVDNPWPAAFYPATLDTGSIYDVVSPYALVTLSEDNIFSIGSYVTFSGLSNALFLKGTSAKILYTPTTRKIGVPISHADYPDTSDEGIVSLGNVSEYPTTRAAIEVGGRSFWIIATKLYEVKADGSYEAMGTLVDDGNPASMAASSTQIAIASGGSLYCYTLATDTLAAVPDPETPDTYITGISQVAFCDGYFIALVKDSAPAEYRISNLMDGMTWDALDVSRVSIFPDASVSMIVDHRELWLLCATKSVAYVNTGNADFPFEMVPGSYIDQGAVAQRATVRLDNSLMWLGRDDRGSAMAWRAQGYTPQRISNHAVENEWRMYGDISDAIGYGFQENGHNFWHIYFPGANKSWRYDAATGFWAEVEHLADGKAEAHRSQCHVFAFGKHLVGDWKSGNIYEMSSDFVDDFGGEIRRVRRCPHVHAEGRYLHFSRLDVEGDYGFDTSLTDGDGNPRAPQMMLRWSDDDGHTWSNEHWKDSGKVGEYGLRVFWNRMGRCWGPRGRVYELVVTDPVAWSLTEGYLEVL